MSYSQSTFLLFSYELNKKKKISRCKIVKNIILDNQLKKEENNYIIELYEIKIENNNTFFNILAPYANIKIDNYELDLKMNNDEMFFFNEKKDLNLNCLSIEEEFNFYYEFIKKDKDLSKMALNSLIKSIFRILKENKEHSTLSLLITIMSKEELAEYINEYMSEKLLLNIEKKGDISKKNIKKLILKLNPDLTFSKKEPYNHFIIICIILEKMHELRYILHSEENIRFVLHCLFRYKKLFENNIKIFPDYSFLIDYVNSIKELYNIFHYIKNLSEFIFLLNDKKVHIFQLIFKNVKDFRIEYFIEHKNDIFDEKFNESFYISLICINEYILNNYKEKIIGFKKYSDYDDFIRFSLFHFFISNEIYDKKYLMKYIYKSQLKKLNEYNNIEIFGLICIISQIRDDYDLKLIEKLISILNNRKISDECIKYLKKIDFNKDFEDILYYEKSIKVFLMNISNIKLFEFLFNIMEKMNNHKNNIFKDNKYIRNKNIKNSKSKEKEDKNENKEIIKKEENEHRKEYKDKDEKTNIEIQKNISMKIGNENEERDDKIGKNDNKKNENERNIDEKNEDDYENKEKNNEKKDKTKINSDIVNLQIKYFSHIQQKFLEILDKKKIGHEYNLINETNKENKDENSKINSKEIIPTISRLIYLSDKYNLFSILLNKLSQILDIEYLNSIYIYTLQNFNISNNTLIFMFDYLLNAKQVNQFVEFLFSKNDLLKKFEVRFEKYLINNDDLFLEENSNNYLLLDQLYKQNYFKSNDSIYIKKTKEILNNVYSDIINERNISYKRIKNLIQKKERIELFLIFDEDGSIKNSMMDYLKKYINIYEKILQELNLINDDFSSINFTSQKNLLKQIEINKFENEIFNSFSILENKIEEFKQIHSLFKDLKKKIHQNSLFIKIKEEQKTEKIEENQSYIIFEQILGIFNQEKLIENNEKIVPLLIYILSLNNDDKNKLIENLSECNNLYQAIYFNQKNPYIIISDNEIEFMKNRIGYLYIKNEIDDIVKRYKIIIDKMKSKKKKKKDDNKNEIIDIIIEIKSFLSLFDITEDTVNKSIKENKIDDLIEKIKNHKIISIINKLNENIPAFEFLLSVTSQDCRNIQELAGEVHGGNNQNFLSIEELLSFEKIVESFEEIDLEDKNDNDNGKEFVHKLIEEIEEEELKKYYEKYQQYKEFFTENLDKNKFTSEIIQKILNKSEILLLNSDINFFKAYYQDDDNNIIGKQNCKEFDYNYMIYLRDRALTKYKINDSLLNNNEKNSEFNNNLRKEEKKIIENNKIFISYVSQINKLLSLLDKIKRKGLYFLNNIEYCLNDITSYFTKIEKLKSILLIKIKIKIQKINDNLNEENSYEIKFYLDRAKKNDYNEIFKIINNIYEKIEIIEKNSYFKKKYINFIYGRQFYLFFDFFFNKNLNENLKYFLSYFVNKEDIIINDFEYKDSNFNVIEDSNLGFYQNFIDNCELFLNKTMDDNGTSLENMYSKNKMKEDFNNYNGIYINSCINLENEIIQWFKYFTNNTPLACTLLLCKQETNVDEIISFLYRAILCEYNICFCLAKTEFLSKDKKNVILDTINEIYEIIKEQNNDFKIHSCLFIMNISLEDDLCKSLFRLKFIKPLDISRDRIKDITICELNDINQKNDIEKIMVIDSDHSGVGKSTYIKNIKCNDYIYFPIGGIFTKENTLKRLQILDKEKNINNKNDLIFHLDLYDTEEKELMNEFLYFILITKLYGQDNHIFHLSKNIRIY